MLNLPVFSRYSNLFCVSRPCNLQLFFSQNFVSEAVNLDSSCSFPIQILLSWSRWMYFTSTLVCLWNCKGFITWVVIPCLSKYLFNLSLNYVLCLKNVSNRELHILRKTLLWIFHIKILAFRLCIFTLLYIDLPYF